MNAYAKFTAVAVAACLAAIPVASCDLHVGLPAAATAAQVPASTNPPSKTEHHAH
ncbi:hypothetical protein [Ramlibacter sp. AN1133]|uniref:hypothetical protein n=1 Tax=Ramlibacter sp. AN1133 TaxID=3133429 RepID=UPI0030C46FE1